MKRSRSEQDTVSLLRATLAGRAARVTRAVEIPDVASVGTERRRGWRWAAPLAAAAAAVAVAGVVLAIQHGGGSPAPATAPSGTQTPTSTIASSGTPSALPTVGPSTSASALTVAPPTSGRLDLCSAGLPPAWRQALAAPVDVGPSPYVFGAFGDGRLLAGRGAGTTGPGAELVLVAPDGSIDTLLSTSASGHGLDAAVDGDEAVLMVKQGGDSAGPGATVERLVAYDARTGQRTTITLPTSGVVDDATVMAGTVYYDRRDSTSAQTGEVIAYDVATGAARVAWRGRFAHREYPTGPLETTLRTAAGGVYLGTQGSVLVAARDLPKAVAAHLTADTRESLLVSDGTSYAWLDGRTQSSARSLYLWGPGMSAPVHLTLPAGFPELVGGDDGAAHFAIDGHWLFTSLQRPMVVDLDTGALVALPGASTTYQLLDGYLVGVRPGGSSVTRLHLTGQPNLHC